MFHAYKTIKNQIQEKLEELRSLYERANQGEEINFPALGLKLRKRSDKLNIKITPREVANIYPLIAKIAYEIMYLYGGAEFFSKENRELRESLLNSIKKREIQKGIFVMRTEAVIRKYSSVHLVRLEFLDFVTILRVAFFGHIEFVLTAMPLSRAFVDNLRNNLKLDDLCALDFQQELDKSKKSFWTVSETNDVKCIAFL